MNLASIGEYKTYHNHRAKPYFSWVKDGIKTIEGRIKKGWYQNIQPGDHIIVYNEEETDHIEVKVKATRTYQSFREMLKNETLHKVLPDAQSIDHGVRIYERFYAPEQEQQHGVIALEIERF